MRNLTVCFLIVLFLNCPLFAAYKGSELEAYINLMQDEAHPWKEKCQDFEFLFQISSDKFKTVEWEGQMRRHVLGFGTCTGVSAGQYPLPTMWNAYDEDEGKYLLNFKNISGDYDVCAAMAGLATESGQKWYLRDYSASEVGQYEVIFTLLEGQIPAGYLLTIQKANGNVGTPITDGLHYTIDAGSAYTITLEYKEQYTELAYAWDITAIDLQDGWNLLGIPGQIQEQEELDKLVALRPLVWDAQGVRQMPANVTLDSNPLTCGTVCWIFCDSTSKAKIQAIKFHYPKESGLASGTGLYAAAPQLPLDKTAYQLSATDGAVAWQWLSFETKFTNVTPVQNQLLLQKSTGYVLKQ
ncbi:MAG: hypothetical protein J6866_03150 [Victivallales bacterium]|nr:hypothetical protein [Victivallales bacterium]